ncbi:MAG: four helix bundle protein [Lentisphaerales bacterium]|nr:four helix bundle protein [Lentisphaerales bacterium]
MGPYENLRVWQSAKSLAVEVYKMIKDNQKLSVDYGLRDQMQRAAVSVPSNIAEGEVSGSTKNSIRYLRIALGSLAELKTQMLIAQEIEYVKDEIGSGLINKMTDLEVKVRNLIQARS